VTRLRREHPAPLPGTAHLRITCDDATRDRILGVLRAYFTTTTPAEYSGGRAYLDVDTRPVEPPHPEAD
jgi:hypothetical protein